MKRLRNVNLAKARRQLLRADLANMPGDPLTKPVLQRLQVWKRFHHTLFGDSELLRTCAMEPARRQIAKELYL